VEEVDAAVVHVRERSIERHAQEPRARSVFRQDRLEIAMEDEGLVAIPEQRPRELHDTLHAVAGLAQMIAKIQRDEGPAAGGPRVIARIGEAGDAFEQNLEFEQHLGFAVSAEAGEPGVARELLLTPQAARVAQQFGVGVGLTCLVAGHCVDSNESCCCECGGAGRRWRRGRTHLRALNTKGCR
jgi:hypothetical protein